MVASWSGGLCQHVSGVWAEDLGVIARVTVIPDERLASLGDVTFGRIEVAPFSVGRFGTLFALILRKPEDEGDVWAVEAQPGNYMALLEPWDSGEYGT